MIKEFIAKVKVEVNVNGIMEITKDMTDLQPFSQIIREEILKKAYQKLILKDYVIYIDSAEIEDIREITK